MSCQRLIAIRAKNTTNFFVTENLAENGNKMTLRTGAVRLLRNGTIPPAKEVHR